jgi:hypothetical protein
MDKSDVITLISTTETQDVYGVWHEEQIQRDIFCQVDSVTASEFFEGGRNGLNPEFRFTVFFGDYNGEKVLIYNGLSYAVYRTYRAKNDRLELYAERKGGTNGFTNGN